MAAASGVALSGGAGFADGPPGGGAGGPGGEAPALTLERAIALAASRNERAQIARERVVVAEAQVEKARSFFLPEVTLRGSYTRRAYDSAFRTKNALSAVGALDLTLFNASAFPLYRRAKLEQELESLESREAERRLAFDVAGAFLATLSDRAILDAAEHRREFARQALEDARARFAAALVSSNDVTRPELELATADRELTRARLAVAAARRELGYLIGAEVPEELAPPFDAFGALTATVAGAKALITQAEAARLDLAARRTAVESAEALAGEPLLRLLPTLELSAQVQATNEAGLSGHDLDGFVAVNLSWPIYDGGERYADRRAALALARIAAEEERAAARRAAIDVELALLQIGESRAARAQAAIAHRLALQNATESAELYREGLASALEVGDANLRLFEAEVGEVREEYGLLLAYLELRSALGLDPLGEEWPR